MAGGKARKESQLVGSEGRVQTTSKGEKRTRRKAVDGRSKTRWRNNDGGGLMMTRESMRRKEKALTCGGGPPGYAWYCCCPG